MSRANHHTKQHFTDTPLNARQQMVAERVAYILAHPSLTTDELAAHLGMTKIAVAQSFHRWKKRGLLPKNFSKHLVRPDGRGNINRSGIPKPPTNRAAYAERIQARCQRDPEYAKAREAYLKQRAIRAEEIKAEALRPKRYYRKWGASDLGYLVAHPEYTPAQMAAHFGIKPDTMRRFISENKRTGRIPEDFSLTPDALGPQSKHKPPKPKKQKAQKPKSTPKPVKKKPVSTAPRFTTSTKKVVKKFETLTNRDAGKVMVLIKEQPKTWVLMSPEKAAQYRKTA